MELLRHPVDYYREQVEPALLSKVEEFRLLGYDRVTVEELWECLQKKKWKKKKDKLLHEVVADILSLQIGDYMSYLTVEAFQGPDYFRQFEGESFA